MADGVSVSIGADTRTFDQAVKSGMVEPVQNAQKALDEYAQTGDHAGGQLEHAFRGQQQQTTELQHDIQKLNSTIRDGSAPAYKKAQQAGDEFTHKSHEGFNEIKESAKSNAIEVGASFTGGFDQAAGGLQGFVSEMLAGFGPAGVVAGIAAAAGIGLLTAQIDAGTQSAEDQKQAVADLAGEYIDAGGKGRRSMSQVVEQLKAMATSTDDNSVSLDEIRKQAERLGMPFRDLARAYTDGGDAQNYAITKTRELLRAEKDRLSTEQLSVSQAGGMAASENERTRALEKQLNQLQANRTEQQKAAKQQAEYLATGAADLQATADATQAYADSVQGALQEAGADWQKYQTKQGVNLAKYNEHMEASIRATEHYQENVATASQTLSQDALNYIESLGEDAAPLLQQYVDAPKGLKARTAANWELLGRSSSDSYNQALQNGIPDRIKGTTVSIDADLSAYHAALNTIDRAPIRRSVVINGVTKSGQPIF